MKVDYGSATGRHWISIDGKEMYQGPGAAVRLRDEDVVKIVRALFPKCGWLPPITISSIEDKESAAGPLTEQDANNTESLHQCRECGTYWRLWRDDGWSLADATQKPGKCCDNAPDFRSKLVPPQPVPPAPMLEEPNALPLSEEAMWCQSEQTGNWSWRVSKEAYDTLRSLLAQREERIRGLEKELIEALRERNAEVKLRQAAERGREGKE